MNKFNIKKYSIIIPAYNVEEYIEECLVSIEKSLENIGSRLIKFYECIIINDGSTDNTGLVIEKTISTFDNGCFRYYQKKNSGLSDTRNYGLELATGKYIIFIDSDDIVSENFFSEIDLTIDTYKEPDITYIGYLKFDDKEKIIQNKKNEKTTCLISNKKLLKYPYFSWLRITKKDLYNNNNFPKGYIYEDVVVSTILAYKAKRIVMLNNMLYFYRKRQGSITTSSPEQQFKLFDSLDVLRNRCIQQNIPALYYNTTYVNMTRSIGVSLARLKNREVFIRNLKKSWQEYDKIKFIDGICSYSSWDHKILFICFKLKLLGLPVFYLLKILLTLLRK
ncbi:glycosyltransferase [Orbaceae bacterium ESL0727]|nr:glycosyltransferase [Orbaceae bacterium ESL0727]